MIHVDGSGVFVTGPGMEVMTQLGMVINNTARSLTRKGADPEYVKSFMHRLVDIALSAPDDGVTIDLSINKGDLK